MRLPVSSLPTKDRPALSNCDIMSGLTYTELQLLLVSMVAFFSHKEIFFAYKHNLPHIYGDVAHQ